MGQIYKEISENFQEFIKQQKIFFVATAPNEGLINLSPKGMESFKVIDKNRVVWLNLTGSGNETAAHILENKRMTVMFCSFAKKPLILRLYGKAEVIYPEHKSYEKLESLFPKNIGTRQFFDMKVDAVQGSCGTSIPYFNYISERKDLNNWAEKKGKDGLEEYKKQKNLISLDGLPTGIKK